jgi:hypothetical protein
VSQSLARAGPGPCVMVARRRARPESRLNHALAGICWALDLLGLPSPQRERAGIEVDALMGSADSQHRYLVLIYFDLLFMRTASAQGGNLDRVFARVQ